MKNIGLNLRIQLFSFSNCNIKPNPTRLPKHQILSPNHPFSQRIQYSECCSVHAHMAWSQKFDTGDSASNAVVKHSVLINQRCAECVCFCCGHHVCGKNILLLYVTVCDKVVPRLSKHDDVIEWNFMTIAPPPDMKSELVAPLTCRMKS